MIADDVIEAAVDRVSELLDLQIGLRPETTLRGRLRRCLRDELSVRGGDIDTYLRTLAGSDHLLQSLVNRVTVQESAFFRHPDHFEVLANDILPGLDPPVTIWSAGCANGQEAYSLAMVLEEQGIQGSVVATDLSTTALARTTAARYSTREIAGLSASRIARHLTRDGDAWEVNRSLRSRVTTLRHNLITDLPGHVDVCQVVLCRNVLIYFSPEHAKDFLDRLAGALAPGAHLILGSAESLWQVTDRFQAVRLGDSFAHRRRDRAGAAPTRQEEPPRRLLQPRPTSRAPLMRAALPRPRPQPAPVLSSWIPETALIVEAGQDALAEGDHAAAVVAFRKWVYLAPDDPLAPLHLGLALEAGGHGTAAQRAFGVARAVTLQVGSERAEVALEGYKAQELLRLLDTKQGTPR
jgi:chemotaxis methyl-accepting protein methylase